MGNFCSEPAPTAAGERETSPGGDVGKRDERTFEEPIEEDHPDVVDINTASEEELITVKGIGQSLARKIVEDRRENGPYANVDDLQRVAGIGQGLLGRFRSQLTCGPGAISDAELVRPTEKTDHRLVDVNSATLQQLQSLPGVGKGLAHKILEDRKANGPFSSVDDVMRVVGIGKAKLNGFRNDIVVRTEVSGSTRGSAKNGDRTDRASTNQHTGTTQFSAYKSRSIVRVATWNLQQFSADKADNVGVKEVVCSTILMSNVSIVVLQELADESALQKICDELNNPTLANIKKLSTEQADWRCVTSPSAGRMYKGSEYNGFLWDASKAISLKSSSLLEKPKKAGQAPFVRRPFLGFFKAGLFDFVAVSVHLKAAGLQDEDRERLLAEVQRLPDLMDAIRDHLPGEKDVLLLGDFNLQPGDDGFKALDKHGYHHALPTDVHTNISVKNLEGSRSYDNIWMSSHTLRTAHSGRYGAVRDGLTHDKIPHGWSWGGTVSDHVPVWAEFFVDWDGDRGSKVDVGGIAMVGSS